jgi:hypothetical protein
VAKICKNCGCFEVCVFANPGRTEDCNKWQPVITYCADCENWDKKHMYIDQCWCHRVVGFRSGTWFCATGKERSNDE